MCPWWINGCSPCNVRSCGTILLRTHIKQYSNGKLYQKRLLACSIYKGGLRLVEATDGIVQWAGDDALPCASTPREGLRDSATRKASVRARKPWS